MYVPELDDEHKTLFRLGDEIYETMLESAGLSAVAEKVQEFSVAMASHFVHEETLMRSSRYPSRAWHRGQHDRMRAKIAEMERSVEQGDREAVLLAIDCISAWLQTHTAVSDRMLGAYLRCHRRSRRSGQARQEPAPLMGVASCRRGSRRQPL